MAGEMLWDRVILDIEVETFLGDQRLIFSAEVSWERISPNS